MTNIQKAKNFGIKYTDNMYARFQDPKMRGSKFTWEKFPELVSGLAEVSVYTMFAHKVRGIKLLEQTAKDSAYNRAKELIRK